MSDPKRLLAIPVAVLVMLGWTTALVIAVLRANYTLLTATTPVMLLLAGYAFGISITRKGD